MSSMAKNVNITRADVIDNLQGGPKTKQLQNHQWIVSNHIKACQWD